MTDNYRQQQQAAQPHPAPTNSYAPVTPETDFPGKNMGIVGLVLAFIIPLVGWIVSAMAQKQSKAAGFANTPAKIGVILGMILTIVGAIMIIVMIIMFATVASTVSTYSNY